MPAVAIAITVIRYIGVISHVHVVVRINVRTAIRPVIPIRVAVVGMPIVAMVINVQMMMVPADRKSRCHTPKEIVVKAVVLRIRVVVNGVGPWIVVVHRLRLVNDNALRLIIRHVNDVFLDWRNLN